LGLKTILALLVAKVETTVPKSANIHYCTSSKRSTSAMKKKSSMFGKYEKIRGRL